MVMLMYTAWEPPVLLPQIVYMIMFCTIVGVPDNVPLAALKVKPVGMIGSTCQEVISPPVLVASITLIAVLLTKVKLYDE